MDVFRHSASRWDEKLKSTDRREGERGRDGERKKREGGREGSRVDAVGVDTGLDGWMMIDGWMVVEINGIFSKLINPFHLESSSVLYKKACV